MGKLWRELLSTNTLTRGWHLARLDSRQDFGEDLFSTDAFGLDLAERIREIISRIETSTYQPRPLWKMEVPKGSLAFRPGTVLPVIDRVVLYAIVLLIAPIIDSKLSKSVFSWRTKNPIPPSGPIFRETAITDLPFLKKTTIREKVDPFNSWYELWPEFDHKARDVFLKQDYKFLATSDIAAYFENIQLPILRDHLMTLLPKEPQIVNLLCQFLESWAERTDDGRVHFRGIPQGNAISSFLGNAFLIPLDDQMSRFCEEHQAVYFRYMDDVRVFTKKREDARLAVFLMARTLRALHLNVQTAKTRIYDESKGEISRLLIDPRVDELSNLIDEINSHGPAQKIPASVRSAYLNKLGTIAKSNGPTGQKIHGTRTPLEGLTVRCFIRWMTAHSLLNSDMYINRLLAEIEKSADHKLARKLIMATRRFPKKRAIETAILKFLESEKNIFPFQEAECLRALRYLSTIRESTIRHCLSRIGDRKQDSYVRMQAAYLVSRTSLTPRQLNGFKRLFELESDPYVQVAIAMLLVQHRSNNQQIVRDLVFHPNEKVRDIGKLFRTVKNDVNEAQARLRHALRSEVPWLICDNMAFLHLMESSTKVEIRQLLLDHIRQPRLEHPIAGIRSELRTIFTRTRKSLMA